jgi:hypothetical protein
MIEISCTVPDGSKGPWSIDTFTVSELDSFRSSFYYITKAHPLISDPGLMEVPPGVYRRLRHAERGVVMSTTPMEVKTNMEFLEQAHGDILINGLGLGMVLETILKKPGVSSVTVIEADEDVLALVGPHFTSKVWVPALTLVHESAFDYEPKKVYDCVWHDIWDDWAPDNMVEMARLAYQYRNHAKWQGFWTYKEMKHMLKEPYRSMSLQEFHNVIQSKKEPLHDDLPTR